MLTLETGVAALVGADGNITRLDPAAYSRALAAVFSEDASERLITTGEAAKIIGKCPKTVARLVDSGAIPSVRSKTGRRLMRESDIRAWLDREQEKTAAVLERLRATADRTGLYDLDDNDEYVRALTNGSL